MSHTGTTPLRRLLHDERGQVLPLVAIVLVGLLGVAALVLDLGHAFVCYRELQAATDAAALAGAQAIPSNTGTSAATSYSAVAGGKNAYANLGTVTMASGYPMLKCLTTLTAQGDACVAPSNANAIVVQEQATVKMYFAGLFGHSTMPITAISTAVVRGSTNSPYNVVILLDTTASMKDYDSDSNCNTTRIACATAGVRVLLDNLAPCGITLSTCGTVTNGNVANAVDRVSLFTFPGVTTNTVQDEYNCSGKKPTVSAYTYPTLPAYQIVPFSSDYRSSSKTTSLSSNSNLVVAADGNKSCNGVSSNGGVGTYYAAALYAAQAALAAQATPDSKNVIVFLSDGDSNASSGNMPGATSKGTYPSYKAQCRQAIAAAQTIAAAGTAIYSVAYGTTSSGCSTDTGGITPCQTMREIASSPANFFSDYTSSAGDGSCVSAAQPTTNLNEIFTQIAGSLTVARLIPNNTT